MGMAADYYKERGEYRPKLQKELPQVMAAAVSLINETYKDGALSHQFKELLALAISINIQCESCIIHHIHSALQAGATKEQIMETLAVTIQMCGGPALAEGLKVVKVLEELTSSAESE